jgi:hypothetical protein
MEQGKKERDGLVELVKETVSHLERLAADHLKLARLELVKDVRTMARDAAGVAMFAPLLMLGYLLALVGLSVVLARWLTLAGAFFAVGGAHLLAGGLGIYIAASRLRRAKAHALQESKRELDRSLAMAGSVAKIAPSEGG